MTLRLPDNVCAARLSAQECFDSSRSNQHALGGVRGEGGVKGVESDGSIVLLSFNNAPARRVQHTAFTHKIAGKILYSWGCLLRRNLLTQGSCTKTAI